MKKDPTSAAVFLRQQQEQIFGQVLRRFAHYGQPTCQAIRQALGRKNGMTFLLQKLGLQPPDTLEYQVQALAGYLKERGAINFLRVIRSKTAPPAPAQAQPEPQRAAAEPDNDATRPWTPPPAPPEAPPQFDERGLYIGPERRLGAERRSGIDRRGDVEMIRSNKRYGGDRRRKIRRLCDRIAASRLGLDARTFPPPPEK